MNWIIPKVLEDLENGLDNKYIKYFYYGIPYAVSDDILRYGTVFVCPKSEEIVPVATGVIDKTDNVIEIIVALQAKTTFYEHAQTDSSLQLLNRIMSGKDADGNLLTDTVRYIIRSHIQDYGVRQYRMTIEYDDKKIEKEDVITATMTIYQEELQSQQINL